MTATTAAQCAPAPNPDEAYQQALQLTLQLAVGYHRADRLQEAEQLYRDILQGAPEHAEANHNLGILLLEIDQPAAGLAYFEAALAAKPESQRYWLSYIDALIRADQRALARERLAFAREHGLEGDAVEALAAILDAGQPAVTPSGAERQFSS
ncbi:MAG: tetratricopeptide repeat protein [Burkholderiales bacterium]|nr:tetratricopeptide repeat protein [Burkholderiales bacterium]